MQQIRRPRDVLGLDHALTLRTKMPLHRRNTLQCMNVTAVVVRASDEAVLLLPSGLPQVEVTGKHWFPDVEAVLRALREQSGIEACVLTCLERPAGSTTYLMVLAGAEPANARWVHAHDDPAVIAARQAPRPAAGLPRDTGLDDARLVRRALPWIDARTTRTGPAAQVRSWGLSNVLRIPTTDGDVYFKALAHSSTVRPARVDALPLLFAHEPLLLQKLSDERPDAVPAPLAIDERRAWMLLPDLGSPLARRAGHFGLDRGIARSCTVAAQLCGPV